MFVYDKKAKPDMLDVIDFRICFTVEKIKANGEDCETHAINCMSAMVSVFDGCGGAGAKSCPKFGGKTEAYVASRAAASAFKDWFAYENIHGRDSALVVKDRFKAQLQEVMSLVGEESRVFGGMSKRFPTTAAAAVCYPEAEGLGVDIYWAGDSRVYLLDADGLAQLTEDDLGGIDAMENLIQDGVLTNMVNLTKDFTIHRAHMTAIKPGIIFAATDGCFGYLSTPMEFEYMLLETLMNAKSAYGSEEKTGWRELLIKQMGSVAGDDYSFSGIAFGFGSFEQMKRALMPRANCLYEQYMTGLDSMGIGEKQRLWEKYRDNYSRCLNRV